MGQADVSSHVRIGDRAMVFGKSGVLSHVPRQRPLHGLPGLARDQWDRAQARLRRSTRPPRTPVPGARRRQSPSPLVPRESSRSGALQMVSTGRPRAAPIGGSMCGCPGLFGCALWSASAGVSCVISEVPAARSRPRIVTGFAY